MKKHIALPAILFCFAILPSCKGHKKEKKSDEIAVSLVPASVQSAFTAKYSTATLVKWENAHENNSKTFKAKFTMNGKKMKAEFDPNGVLIKAEEDD